MKNILLATALVFCFVATPSFAQTADPHAAEFKAFYASFLSAAKANDRQKIVDMIGFPVDNWAVQTRGDVQEEPIKDKADFLKRYDVLFTTYMRSHVQAARPQALQDDRYVVIWDDADAEFSFEFGYDTATGFRVTSYSIGPR